VSASTGPTYYSNVDYDTDPRKSYADERGVDLLPDPRQSSRSDPDTDPAAAVPVPLRVTKKRRRTKPSTGDVSASDVSISGSGDLAAPGVTSPGREPSAPPAYANLSYEGDTPEGKRREKKKGTEAGKDGKRRRPRDAGQPDPIRDPVMRNMAAEQQQLRVHIKAQPGTAVHITPSATPPTRPGQDQAPAYHARPGQQPTYQRPQVTLPFSSGPESETEIWWSLLLNDSLT